MSTSEALILEKQLMDTVELQWQVRQIRIRSRGATATKTRLLFDGMAGEIQTFIDLIRKRLESWSTGETHVVEIGPDSYWRLFVADSIDYHEQFEALICAYVHYEKETSQAIASLRLPEDLESVELLRMVSKAVERCVWFLAIYLEGLALNAESRLPDWPTVAAS